MQVILTLENLIRMYQFGNSQVLALNGISFSVGSGEFISIVGRSGSGKSTLLNIIGGLDQPTSGRLLFEEKDLAKMTRIQLAKHRRYAVGMIFQSFNLVSSRTALENVELSLLFARTGKRERRLRARELLRRLGLEERFHHKPSELSGGEQQRVAIARALANTPRILLADEPTGNLDSNTSREIIDLLSSLNAQGMTVLMVTHEEDLISNVSHRLIRLMDGCVVEDLFVKGVS